jgi:hypothetical protein
MVDPRRQIRAHPQSDLRTRYGQQWQPSSYYAALSADPTSV